MPKKVYIRTFGCQMNMADSERMSAVLEHSGWRMAKDEDSADVILLNTCSVRQLAEDKVWGKLGRLKNKKIVGVTGCMAQNYGADIFRRAPHVNLVCGTYRFHNINQLLQKALNNEKQVIDIGTYEDVNGLVPGKSAVCAWVPIMRGCNNACSYCVVPQVRGPERSRPIEEIVKEISSLVANGCREVTLLGQNVNSYRSRNQKPETRNQIKNIDFPALLREVNEIGNLGRIRFITSHPKDTGLEMFQCLAGLDKVCESLHLPIQSGSNRILAKMNRGYTREHYLGLITKLRELVPAVALSTDIIVGFPGESDEDFQDTCDLMRQVQFDSAFIFKYSPRSGTAAVRLADDVPLTVKKERNQRLLHLQDKTSLAKNKSLLGKELEVLVEGPSKSNKNRLLGRTRTNKIVVFTGQNEYIGKLVNVRIKDTTNYTLYGNLL